MISTKTIENLEKYIDSNSFKIINRDNIVIFLNLVNEFYHDNYRSLTLKINEYIENDNDLDEIFIDLIKRKNNSINYEVIDSSKHISKIAECIMKNNYNITDKSVIEEFMNKNVINDNDQSSSSESSDYELKSTIRYYKRSHDNFPLYYGHFMESLVANLLKMNLKDNGEINEKHNLSYFTIISNIDTLIEIGLNDTKNEIYVRNSNNLTLLNDYQIFVQNFIHDEFKTYIPKLYTYISQFIREIEQKTSSRIISIICKKDYSYRGIHAEVDYLLEMKMNDRDNDDRYYILIDCKNYEKINEQTMTKFLYQLIGYYQQHLAMRLHPSKRISVQNDIRYFCIVNPLNCNNEFSYYLYHIDKQQLDEYIIIFEDYINKCFDICE